METLTTEYEKAGQELGSAISGLTDDGAKAVLRNLIATYASDPNAKFAIRFREQILAHADGMPKLKKEKRLGFCSRMSRPVMDRECLACYTHLASMRLRAETDHRRMECVRQYISKGGEERENFRVYQGIALKHRKRIRPDEVLFWLLVGAVALIFVRIVLVLWLMP